MARINDTRDRVLDKDEYVSGDDARITATADNLTINNSGNLLATGSGQVIDSGDSAGGGPCPRRISIQP